MDVASLATIGDHVAVALAAGRIATKKETVAPAILDRYKALKRAVSKRSSKIGLGEIEDEPTSEERRAALAKALEEHGACKDRDVITTAKELLSLIKVDEGARESVDAMIEDVEKALIELSDVDVDAMAEAPKPAESNRSVRDVARSSRRGLASETGSQRVIPPEEHSKTELERLALPIHKRTDRFFMKLGILVGVVVAGAVIGWIALRTPPDAVLEACRNGDKARCWEIVAAEDTVDQGRKVSAEPLGILCDKHQDACACAGLAYLNASKREGTVDCAELESAAALDPKWPCTCRRYEFWRWGEKRTTSCGIPRCE
jgi:hypothetical protein